MTARSEICGNGRCQHDKASHYKSRAPRVTTPPAPAKPSVAGHPYREPAVEYVAVYQNCLSSWCDCKEYVEKPAVGVNTPEVP